MVPAASPPNRPAAKPSPATACFGARQATATMAALHAITILFMMLSDQVLLMLFEICKGTVALLRPKKESHSSYPPCSSGSGCRKFNIRALLFEEGAKRKRYCLHSVCLEHLSARGGAQGWTPNIHAGCC